MPRIPTSILLLLMVLPAGACTTTEDDLPQIGARRVAYQCEGGESVVVAFSRTAATLEAGGALIRMTQQPSGSGIRYAGAGHELTGQGPEIVWTDAAGARHPCRETSANAD